MTLKEVFPFVGAKELTLTLMVQRQPVAPTNVVKMTILKIATGVSKRKPINMNYALTVVKRDMESARSPQSGRGVCSIWP